MSFNNQNTPDEKNTDDGPTLFDDVTDESESAPAQKHTPSPEPVQAQIVQAAPEGVKAEPLKKRRPSNIYTVKVAVGHEKIVADMIAGKAKRLNAEIYSIISPTKLRGYLLIESSSIVAVQELVKNIQHVRGVVQGTTPIAQIIHFLTPKPLVSGITEGCIVELVAGPFKGEKARVQQIDRTKEEITVEMFESMVPIPVTVRADHVRVLEKEGKDRDSKDRDRDSKEANR